MVGFGGNLYPLSLSFYPNRLITCKLALLINRRYIGVNPVKPAGFSAILHDSAPSMPLLKVVPHIGKRRFRHRSMANDIVIFS
ncbi:Uncharacterised protein [Vibrio cholerae]|nr:Uncharacterised protein [Vibrio cholerae]CSI73719.1 Uncharacterised protein [Vibrio cholerae]